MLTISKVLTILCLLCLYRGTGKVATVPYTGSFQNQISKLFFQMSARVYPVPGQTEGRRKAFLELRSIDLPSILSLTCRDKVNDYKSVHHPIPTLPVGIGSILEIFKTN